MNFQSESPRLSTIFLITEQSFITRSSTPCSGNQIQIQIILLHNVFLHSQTEFDQSYGNPQ